MYLLSRDRAEHDDIPREEFDDFDEETLLVGVLLRFRRVTLAVLRREEASDDSGVELYLFRCLFGSGVELRLRLLLLPDLLLSGFRLTILSELLDEDLLLLLRRR